MPSVLSAALLVSLLAVAAGVPAPLDDHLNPTDQLTQLLGPIVESAVGSALAHWQPPPPAVPGHLQQRLDTLERELAELRAAPQTGCDRRQLLTLPVMYLTPQQAQEPESVQEPVPEPEPEPEPVREQVAELEATCEKEPAAAPVGSTHRRPEAPACARSCLQLRDQGGSPQDGVYWLTGLPVPVLCDFSHDGGGWTLLLTAASKTGWDALSVLQRSEHSPSLAEDYAILRYADALRDLGGGGRFAYRIEAQAQTGRRQWGGVWVAPRSYSFVSETPAQTAVSLVRKFNRWTYKNAGIEKRMPWLNTGDGAAVLTTSVDPGSWWWGTLANGDSTTVYDHSPWIEPDMPRSGTVLYWMREEML